MSNSCCSTAQKWIGSALLLTSLTLLTIAVVDIPVALFIKNNLYANTRWSQMTSDLPDLLMMVVVSATMVAFPIYLVRSRKGIYDTLTHLAKLVAWIAPASFAAKHFLKFVFGRLNTRYWMEDPSNYGWYWFQSRKGCNGFPSGHMLVMVALLAALWRFYPKSRPFCIVVSMVLAVALILTNYHYVSDVIAGAYLGVVIEAIAFYLLFREPSRLRVPGSDAS